MLQNTVVTKQCMTKWPLFAIFFQVVQNYCE